MDDRYKLLQGCKVCGSDKDPALVSSEIVPGHTPPFTTIPLCRDCQLYYKKQWDIKMNPRGETI